MQWHAGFRPIQLRPQLVDKQRFLHLKNVFVVIPTNNFKIIPMDLWWRATHFGPDMLQGSVDLTPHSRASQLGQTYECVPQGVSPSSVWCTPRSLRCSKRTWICKQHQRGGLPEVCPWRKNWRKVYSKFWKSRSICNKEGCSWRFEWVRFSPWMKSNRETGGSTWLPFLERWIRLPSSGGSCWRTETHIYRWS